MMQRTKIFTHSMQRYFLLLLCCLSSSSVSWAQPYEYAKRESTMGTLECVTAGAPVKTTAAYSKAEMIYNSGSVKLVEGESIRELSFRGYNPNDEMIRHFTVWMENTKDMRLHANGQFHPTDQMQLVFDGDCTITKGGSADETIEILRIMLDEPLVYTGDGLRIVVVGSGEPSAADVCFEQSSGTREGYIATASAPDTEFGEATKVEHPMMTLTVGNRVGYFSGVVENQDGKPIPNALVQFTGLEKEANVCETRTDDNGHYRLRIEQSLKHYIATSVTAEGCAAYEERFDGFDDCYYVWEDSILNFTLIDAVDYVAEQQSTIVLPITPNPSAGRYFRLDHHDKNIIYFERELAPQANIPYVFFPASDFRISLKDLDLSVNPNRVQTGGVSLVGLYKSYHGTGLTTGNYIERVIDTNPALLELGFEGMVMRALLMLDYFTSYQYGEPELVFHDETSEIQSFHLSQTTQPLFDLTGRPLSTPPTRGMYIQNGKKVIK